MADFAIDTVFFIIFSCIFVWGSVESFEIGPLILSIFNSILFIGVKLARSGKLNIPRNFGIYGVFVLSLLIHYFIFGGQIIYFELFLTGGLYWLMIANTRDIFSKYFFILLIFLGFYMVCLYILSSINGAEYLYQNLYHSISPTVRHNHLGDLWAIILVSVVYKMSVKTKGWHIFLMILGLVIIALSSSRSALVSLIAGSGFILYFGHNRKDFRKVFVALVALSLLLFLYFAFYKTTIFSRPYFLEAINLILKYPLGIGLGNFSRFNTETIWTHNLILEIVLGQGIFSAFFIIWLVRVFRSFTQKSSSILYKALFLAILVNFSFDTTYVIPTMIWLWFGSLALL